MPRGLRLFLLSEFGAGTRGSRAVYAADCTPVSPRCKTPAQFRYHDDYKERFLIMTAMACVVVSALLLLVNGAPALASSEQLALQATWEKKAEERDRLKDGKVNEL